MASLLPAGGDRFPKQNGLVSSLWFHLVKVTSDLLESGGEVFSVSLHVVAAAPLPNYPCPRARPRAAGPVHPSQGRSLRRGGRGACALHARPGLRFSLLGEEQPRRSLGCSCSGGGRCCCH